MELECLHSQSSINVSPSCWKNPRGCFRFDNVNDVINLKDEIDYLLMIDNGSSSFAQDYPSDNGFMAAEAAGMEWIFIDTFTIQILVVVSLGIPLSLILPNALVVQ